MKESVFDYQDYKKFLRALISSRPKGGRGIRLAIAKHIGCPVSHISQVLNGKPHLSMEQAEGLNEYLGHTQDEAAFFFLLIQLSRAGTTALKKRLELQVEQILEKRIDLKVRLGVAETLSNEAKAIFYSSWVYGAIHVMISIEKFQTKEAIAQHLGLSVKKIGEILEFLISTGLAVQKDGGKFIIGNSRIHLGNDSPLIAKFHTNWRIQAIRSMDHENFVQDLHYSSAITISKKDVQKIKERLIKCIEENNAIIKDSKEEEVHCLALDFFQI